MHSRDLQLLGTKGFDVLSEPAPSSFVPHSSRGFDDVVLVEPNRDERQRIAAMAPCSPSDASPLPNVGPLPQQTIFHHVTSSSTFRDS